jgi:hypothetical protein
MADHVTNRMLRDKACGRAPETKFPCSHKPLPRPRQRMCGGRGSSSATFTAMRFPFTTTVPLATGRLFARMLTASSSEASSSMMAPRPSRS